MPDDLKKLGMDELGSTGLDHDAGQVRDEFLKQLWTSEKRYEVTREMADNDPVVGSILFSIEQLVRSSNWRVDPYSREAADIARAEFIDSAFGDMNNPWDDIVSEILSMIPHGFASFETVYKKRDGLGGASASQYSDGLIGWRKIAIRAQETIAEWVFDEDGGLQGLIQEAPPKYDTVSIPIEKILLFRTTNRKGNPEGRSMLRNAYRPWFFKKRLETIEAMGLERGLVGIPVAWVPPGILGSDPSTEEAATLSAIKKIVTNIRRDEQAGVVFPLSYDENGHQQYNLTLLSTGFRGTLDTGSVIARYDSRIALSMLADFVLLGQNGVGTQALSVSKIKLFVSALDAIMGQIAKVMNKFAIPRLLAVNGMDLLRAPKLNYGKINVSDAETTLKTIDSMTRAGAPLFPDDELENHLRANVGLPTKDSDEIV